MLHLTSSDILALDDLTSDAVNAYSVYYKEVCLPYYQQFHKKNPKFLTHPEFIYLHCIDNWNLSIPIPEYEDFNNYYDNIYMRGVSECLYTAVEAQELKKAGKEPNYNRELVLVMAILKEQMKYA